MKNYKKYKKVRQFFYNQYQLPILFKEKLNVQFSFDFVF